MLLVGLYYPSTLEYIPVSYRNLCSQELRSSINTWCHILFGSKIDFFSILLPSLPPSPQAELTPASLPILLKHSLTTPLVLWCDDDTPSSELGMVFSDVACLETYAQDFSFAWMNRWVCIHSLRCLVFFFFFLQKKTTKKKQKKKRVNKNVILFL